MCMYIYAVYMCACVKVCGETVCVCMKDYYGGGVRFTG